MPIHGIFYARFLPQKVVTGSDELVPAGTKIVAQSPPGCIVPVAAADESESDNGSGAHRAGRGKALFDFEVMQEYVIPRPAFFNRYVAAREPSGRFTVLGLPVAIRDAKYDRNEFIFNFGIVVESGDDQGPYEQVVRRLASTFAEMEKQNEFLSREERREQGRRGGGGMGELGASIGDGLGRISGHGVGNSAGLSISTSVSNLEGLGSRGRRLNTPQAPLPPETPLRRRHELLGQMMGAPPSAGHNTIAGMGTGMGVGPGAGLGAGSGFGTTTAIGTHHSPYHRRSIQSLLEIIKEDLNLYGECMIPVDDANTINMKLFPQHADPPAVEGWHVPVPKMRLAEIVDPSWDLTLQRVIAHMDGVSDVRRIAYEADVSLELCRAALRHLLYYDTILLLDLFLFGSCYAPRPGIHDFVANVGGIVDECARYVCLRPYSKGSAGLGYGMTKQVETSLPSAGSAAGDPDDPDDHHRPPRVSNFDLVRLMTSFCVGRTVTEWLKGHADAGFDVLRFVDVRRLVQFGVIKGCLYRVHKYAVSKQYIAALVTGQAAPKPGIGSGSSSSSSSSDPLQRYTDGNHHFDQITTELNLTEVEILDKLKRFPPGDVKILYR
ncbi:nitrogen permease regulator [Grosmannia clavigera kw1407]|uniref:Nitrogen permease regulator n=1 Tax=Grosmannia clavigera (strain kw1407 / UAMH 11150) TaxID=655863 RepID=F0XDP9_GROCL|nr:nitrogen permease regulator [Grosmannia clavigera kw1407]EFX03550.1 nitrogen permease regulator [Grosmannia clavigera kw1407]